MFPKTLWHRNSLFLVSIDMWSLLWDCTEKSYGVSKRGSCNRLRYYSWLFRAAQHWLWSCGGCLLPYHWLGFDLVTCIGQWDASVLGDLLMHSLTFVHHEKVMPHNAWLISMSPAMRKCLQTQLRPAEPQSTHSPHTAWARKPCIVTSFWDLGAASDSKKANQLSSNSRLDSIALD